MKTIASLFLLAAGCSTAYHPDAAPRARANHPPQPDGTISVSQLKSNWDECRKDDKAWDKFFVELRPSPGDPDRKLKPHPKWLRVWGRVEEVRRIEGKRDLVMSDHNDPSQSVICYAVDKDLADKVKEGDFIEVECYAIRESFYLVYSKVWDWKAPAP